MSTEVKTPVGDAPILPVAMIGIGGYLMWFAVHYWKGRRADGGVLWPTDPIKSALSGVPIGTTTASQTPAEATLAADVSAIQSDTGSGSSVNGSLTPSGGGTPSRNQSLAKMLAISMGHSDWTTGQQWADWVKLWDRESGWSQTAKNPSSGAYGIPQALPATKMPAAAQPPPVGTSNPQAQITWGITYIAQRYGSPSAAWAHEVANNWY